MIIAPPKLSIHLKGCLDLCFNSIMENENLETSTPAPEQLLREFAVKGLAGQLLSGATSGITFVVDSLFVFRSDRRTVHDLIVGSKVIQL